MSFRRLKNQFIAKVIARFPSLAERLTASYEPWKSVDIPWTPVTKALATSTVALVTTAGVHHREQKPFDMKDHEGDPSFRVIDYRKPLLSLMITHDYYDHSDADRDINIVFPLERLREFEQEGRIGHVADLHYGFMGHITGRNIPTLIHKSASEVARSLKKAGVDVVLLTPG
ncbi:MAG TPA: glycine/sarcosine/betaine reductase selenoprotein B family protein [Nitrospirota bacterium]|nr:glycine/sarcosine/betaine reductase selenoprotein B family protein [Nitrospirota bacterium]